MNKLLMSAMTMAALSLVACGSDDDPQPDNGGNGGNGGGGNKPTPENFEIPQYSDDYSAIAAWKDRSKWNLANVHDPSVVYYQGKYYMYGTDASYGNEHAGHGHFQGKSSTDLVNWNWLSGIFYDSDRPTWIVDSLNSMRSRMKLAPIAAKDISFGYWAPVVRVVNVGGQEKMRMYYSVVIDNYIKTGKPNTSANYDGSWTERAFIGMAETTDPENGTWEDRGYVTTSSTDKGPDGWARKAANNWDGYFYFNAIDPAYIVTPEGEHWLIHGSWHSGFTVMQLDPVSGKPLQKLRDPWATSAAGLVDKGFGRRIATRDARSRWQGSEAPEVVYRDGYYYLFMAYDGLDVPYNTRVARSKNINGPYIDVRGQNITNGSDAYPIVTHPYKFKYHSGWVGISHCCVFESGTDDNEWFYMSQGRLPAGINGNQYSNALMMGHVRRIVWAPSSASNLDDVWPIALPERYAAVPDYGTITTDSLVGKWEHIELTYQYAKQCQSDYVELKADGTVTGALTGRWSYDESKKLLTIGNVAVCVEREVDWEASPRCVTLVYAGIGSPTSTWWGKKVK